MVPAPVADARWLKPTGRTLGTTAEWEAFLRFEEWKRLGYGRGRAIDLAAWELYGGENFGGTRGERKERASKFLATRPKAQKRASKIESQVERVEKSVASVFPEFAPFSA